MVRLERRAVEQHVPHPLSTGFRRLVAARDFRGSVIYLGGPEVLIHLNSHWKGTVIVGGPRAGSDQPELRGRSDPLPPGWVQPAS